MFSVNVMLVCKKSFPVHMLFLTLYFCYKQYILYAIVVCKQRNIPRLIYTSTVNVVFGGNTIEEGDEETVPYFPLEKVFCLCDIMAFAVLRRVD